MAAATPSLPMKERPETQSPISAMMTVQPDTRTGRPLVATALPAPVTGSAPSMRFCRCRVIRKSA